MPAMASKKSSAVTPGRIVPASSLARSRSSTAAVTGAYPDFPGQFVARVACRIEII
jgi:hypothetical protein